MLSYQQCATLMDNIFVKSCFMLFSVISDASGNGINCSFRSLNRTTILLQGKWSFCWVFFYQTVILRMISYGCDYHWSYKKPLFDQKVDVFSIYYLDSIVESFLSFLKSAIFIVRKLLVDLSRLLFYCVNLHGHVSCLFSLFSLNHEDY